MSRTYGEQLLAAAAARARARNARRRRLLLMPPAAIATLWSLADLVTARSDRFAAEGAGLFRTGIGLVTPVVWTVLFVFAPLLASLKRDPLPAGSLLALLAGPVLSPILFGAGGWHAWQIAVVTIVTVLVLGAARTRARTIVLD